jgi:fumarate hydratase class II
MNMDKKADLVPKKFQRIEHDSLGDVLAPIHALYGAQTQRAVETFPYPR